MIRKEFNKLLLFIASIVLIISSCGTAHKYKKLQNRADRYITYTDILIKDTDRDGVIDIQDIDQSKLNGMPIFNIPPPYFDKVKNDYLKNWFPGTKTFGEIDSILTDKLEVAGFKDNYKHYKVTTREDEKIIGWAIATSFEQIDENGNVLPDRWSGKVEEGGFRWGLFKQINKGYFRMFAFIITDSELLSNNSFDLTKEQLELLEKQATTQKGLPKIIKDIEYKEDYKMHILVYEFYQYETDVDGYYLNMDHLSVDDQLRKANLDLIK